MGAVHARPEDEWWAALPVLSLRQAVTGAAPQQTTSVKLAWDEAELRVLFEVHDTHVWATLTERDGPLYQEEVVEVFLDPVGDLESYFEIEVNPLNAVLDLVLRKNRSGYAQDFAWDCEGLRTAARRTAQGWCAELAIPLRSLVAEAPQVGTRWRGNFCRIDRPPGVERELSAWSPTQRGTFHTPERFGRIEFVGESS
jgi:hypothetical protein